MKLAGAAAETFAPGSSFVELEDVSMTYQGASGAPLQALDGVHCRIDESQFCSVVGPSGCGKSTLLMITAGLYQPTSGRVLVGGRPVAGPSHEVGMVFQKDVLLEWRTVLANLLLPIEVKRRPSAEDERRARSLLEMVGLSGFEAAFPCQLSLGMRQRAAICRSLMHDPPLLLMDEPFASVDLLTREKLSMDLLRLTAARPKTVVFVTHSIEEAVLLSDRVLVMSPRPGRVLRQVEVDLPKPRSLASRSDPRFHRLVDEIRSDFLAAGVLS
jgi:NitT/TauT family transport system ATP-binding protein